MTYRFKPLQELYWGVVIAAALVLLQGLVTLDPEAITNWQTWAIALGGGMVRAAAGAAIDYLRRSMTTRDAEGLSEEDRKVLAQAARIQAWREKQAEARARGPVNEQEGDPS